MDEDPMTPAERSARARLMKRVSVDDADTWAVLATCDRLVARVEKLLALVAQQQKVVEAARRFRAAFRTYIDDEDAELPDTGPELDAALAALPAATKEK